MPHPRNVSVLLQNITRYTCNTRYTRVCALEHSLSSDPLFLPFPFPSLGKRALPHFNMFLTKEFACASCAFFNKGVNVCDMIDSPERNDLSDLSSDTCTFQQPGSLMIVVDLSFCCWSLFQSKCPLKLDA